METRFAVIEKEQAYMKQRINGVESKTNSISDNIQAMMEYWKITPTSYKRKPEAALNDSEKDEEENIEYANHSISLVQGQGDKCF
jgi:Zn-dependent peptidase ImmA (M78 family)